MRIQWEERENELNRRLHESQDETGRLTQELVQLKTNSLRNIEELEGQAQDLLKEIDDLKLDNKECLEDLKRKISSLLKQLEGLKVAFTQDKSQMEFERDGKLQKL